ncbi:MAG: SAM-dependent methyltransferase [Oscillibacter sp.]|nr:SAM-dependent methyltransferase [Oscillibacter sp.]
MAAVSKLISQLAIHKQATVNKIYDPAAGSGSLLLQAKRQFENRIIEYSQKSLLLLRNSKELEDNCNTR